MLVCFRISEFIEPACIGDDDCKQCENVNIRKISEIYHATQLKCQWSNFVASINIKTREKVKNSKFPYFIVHHRVSIKICKIPSQLFFYKIVFTINQNFLSINIFFVVLCWYSVCWIERIFRPILLIFLGWSGLCPPKPKIYFHQQKRAHK